MGGGSGKAQRRQTVESQGGAYTGISGKGAGGGAVTAVRPKYHGQEASETLTVHKAS